MTTAFDEQRATIQDAFLAELEAERAEYAAAHLARQLPARYRDADPSADRAPALADWKPGRSVVLTGPSGSGKSHQLAVLAKLQHAAGQSVVWFDEIELVDRLRDSTRDAALFPTQVLACSTVAIDDFGKARSTPVSAEKLFQVVNHAYQHQRVLLVSTELSARQIAEAYGAALCRRLVELAGGEFTALDVAWWKRATS